MAQQKRMTKIAAGWIGGSIAVLLAALRLSWIASRSSVLPPVTVQSRYDNLALGVPGRSDIIIDRAGFSLGYMEKHKQSAWVIYKLTRAEVLARTVKRGSRFAADPEIPGGSAADADYRHSGLDRGHLAPAADMAFSERAMAASFYYSNVSPQHPRFNRGVWKKLEEQVRRFALQEGEIYVAAGPVLPRNNAVAIGPDRVTVPTHYYKVVYDPTPPRKMIGFILPNRAAGEPLRFFAVTVDAVERVTGLDFFSLLPKERQEKLESTLTIPAWNWMD